MADPFARACDRDRRSRRMQALGLSETMHFVACSAKHKEKKTSSNIARQKEEKNNTYPQVCFILFSRSSPFYFWEMGASELTAQRLRENGRTLVRAEIPGSAMCTLEAKEGSFDM